MSYYIAMDRYGNYDLAHHGILGQKWGIRRYQNKDGSLTPAGIKRYASDNRLREKINRQNAKKAQKIIDSKPKVDIPEAGIKSEYKTFLGKSEEDDIRINKGTIGYRVQASKDSSHDIGHTYLTFDPKGHLEYLYATMSPGGDGMGLFNGAFNGKDIKGYSVKMKMSEDILLPSYKKSMESFVKSIGQVGIKNAAKIVEKQGYSAKDFIQDVKHMSVEDCRNRAYINFIRVVAYNDQLKNAFFNDLKAQGYNAVIDENDHHFGKGSYGGAPVIVFDKKKSLSEVGKRAIDSAMANDIQEVYDQYGNMAKQRISTMEQLDEYWKKNNK